MTRAFILLLLFSNLCLATNQQTLTPGQNLEREIAPGESHSYSIKLSAGQFIRVHAEQRNINLAIELADAGGREILANDFSAYAGGRESLSYEAAQSGDYRIIIRPAGATSNGSYRARLEVKDAAAPDDRKRINAESQLMDALGSIRKSDQQAGIEKASRVLPLWRELSDPYFEAQTLSMLGAANGSLRRFDQATDYHTQSLALRRQIKDRAGESNVLSDLASVSIDQNRRDQALTYATEALEIKRELKDRAGEAAALYAIALAKFNSGKFSEVVTLGDQVIEMYQSLGDRTGLANAYNIKGNSHINLRQFDEAVRNHEKALEIFRELKDRGGEGRVLHNLGISATRSGDLDRALDLYGKALTIRRALKDRLNEGTTLSNLSNVFQMLGEYEKALESAERGLSLARELKDPVGEASALLSICSLYQKLGQNKEAREKAQAALSIAMSSKDPIMIRRSYSALEIVAFAEARYEEALEHQERMLRIDREAKSRQPEILGLIQLGGTYRRLGRFEKGNEVLEEALAISREIKSRTNEAFILANIGLIFTVQGKYREAIPYHEKAVAIFRETKMPSMEARILINLSECAQKLGKSAESIELTGKAIALAREGKDRDAEGIALTNRGAAFSATGQFAKASDSLTEALAIAREMGNPSEQRDALNELVRLERNQGNLAKAAEYLDQSLKSLENTRNEILNPASRASFLAAEHQVVDLQIDLLMRQRQADPAMAALALEANERSRARVLLELLNEAHVDIREGVDPALVKEEQELGTKVSTWAGRLEQARKPALAARLKQELGQLEREYERVQAAVRKASPQYAALTQPQPLKLFEIQQQLDTDTLLLEYSLGEERSYLWAITRDSLASYELPKGESIKTSALEVYEALTARSISKRGETVSERRARIARADAQLDTSAKGLSQTLLSPVSAQLGNKRLVIVADGALQYVPFAMLPDPATTAINHPLIVNHEVVSLPSASALAIQRTLLAGRKVAPKMLAVVADPVFDRSDVRFKSLPREAMSSEPSQQSALNDVRSIEHLSKEVAGEGISKLVIPRLPFTRQEADQLMALAPKDSSFRAIDFDASRSTALNRELSQYRYVHFATHGLMDTERPGLSSLVLSMVDREGNAQDAFLRANDIYNLKLPAELVVLSACQTGLGKEVKGEGLVGLTRGFMYAGAARVVVSLWNVNDRATANLMTTFYEKMLKRGERPAAALRAAQVEMWKTRQWQSPYYWAPFTLQGEWR